MERTEYGDFSTNIRLLIVSSLQVNSSWVPQQIPPSWSGTWRESSWPPSTPIRWPILMQLSPPAAGQAQHNKKDLKHLLQYLVRILVLTMENQNLVSPSSLCPRLQVCSILRLHSRRESLGSLLWKRRRVQRGSQSIRPEGPLCRSSCIGFFQWLSQVIRVCN